MELRGRKEGDRLHDASEQLLLSALWSLLAMCRQFPVSRATRPLPGVHSAASTTYPVIRTVPGAAVVQGDLSGSNQGPPPAGVLATERRAADGATRSCPVLRFATRAEGPVFFSLTSAVFVSRNHVDSEGDTGRQAFYARCATDSRAGDGATNWECAVPVLFRFEQAQVSNRTSFP